MEKRNVWDYVDIKDIPPDIKPIGLKWIFKIKSSGEYKSRLVALGNNQREGIDYYDSHSPVMNDITLRLLMIICVLKNLNFWKLDIEAAFLEGTLD